MLALAACDTADPDFTLHRGWLGYPCYFDQECLAPLVCETTPSAATPVCTGTALHDEPCGPSIGCAWIRDERGLPLECAAGGRCLYPGESVPGAAGDVAP